MFNVVKKQNTEETVSVYFLEIQASYILIFVFKIKSWIKKNSKTHHLLSLRNFNEFITSKYQ